MGDLVTRKDGYICATVLCKQAGAQFHKWASKTSTKSYVKACSMKLGIPEAQMINIIRGGFSELQGSWIHPELLGHLQAWLSRTAMPVQPAAPIPLEMNQVLFVATSRINQRENRFRIDGVNSVVEIPNRISSYNNGRRSDDPFFVVQYWKVLCFEATKSQIKSILAGFRDKQTKAHDEYFLNGARLVEVLEHIVADTQRAVTWINAYQPEFMDETINKASTFSPLVLK